MIPASSWPVNGFRSLRIGWIGESVAGCGIWVVGYDFDEVFALKELNKQLPGVK